MSVRDRELGEAIKAGMKTLILLEVRLLRLERGFTPHIVIEEMSQSIRDTKKEISRLAKAFDPEKRTPLLKRMIRQAVDEEIDRAIEMRNVKCIRCLHGRFYDRMGAAYVSLPLEARAETIGCDKLQSSLRKSCRRFVETAEAISLDDYLSEMTFLYEFREVINRIEEIWKEYFTK
ncbi:MAG: hypothetical protein ACE144_18185 [Thermodesulfobacteriota bacterium]